MLEVVTLIAILVGPVLAVQTDKFLTKKREEKNSKLSIFKTLMATRGAGLSVAHVEALNRIYLEFSNSKFKNVTESWREYFDNLCQNPDKDEQVTVWRARNEELLANLLYEMGKSLGYEFDKVLIKRGIYFPRGHEQMETENQIIRNGMVDILMGKKELPINIAKADIEIDVDKQRELQNLMIQYYKGEIQKIHNTTPITIPKS